MNASGSAAPATMRSAWVSATSSVSATTMMLGGYNIEER
jgi:hypothetical protein